MSKSNIEQLIADKLQSLSFDFKSEYWDTMNEKLDADCAKTNTCRTTSIGIFYSTSLLLVFFSIISVLLFFPWGINSSVDTNGMNTVEVPTVVNNHLGQNSIDKNIQAAVIQNKEDHTITAKPVATKTSVDNNKSRKVSHTRKHHKKSASPKYKKASMSIANQSISDDKNSKLDSNRMLSENKDINSIDSTQKDGLQTTSEIEKIDTSEGITTDTLTTDADFAYEPEMGDEPAKVEKKEAKVKVQKKPVPVKHVKTRSKPVKRVFKRKRGILYRLGIRK